MVMVSIVEIIAPMRKYWETIVVLKYWTVLNLFINIELLLLRMKSFLKKYQLNLN